MLKIIKKIILIAVFGFGFAVMLGAVEAHKISARTVLMDGRLDDPFWQEIKPPLAAFHVFQEKDKTTGDTRVKIAFDDQYLYFGLECINMEPCYDRNAAKTHDGEICNDDSVEIYISSDPDRQSYCHFMLNCDNVKAEQKIAGRGDAAQIDRGWNPVWLSAVAKNEHGWSAEIAVPVALLSEHGKVGALSFNIARTKVIPEFDTQGVKLGEKRQWSALFPVNHSFKEPESFAELKGVDAIILPNPSQRQGDDIGCQLKLDGSTIGEYYLKNGKTFYDVCVRASYGGSNFNWAFITVADKTERGKITEVTEKVCVGAGSQANIKLAVPAENIENRTVTVILKDYLTEGVVDQLTLVDLAKLTPLDACFSRNYYTSENYAELACSVALPPETLRGAAIIIKNSKAEELLRADTIGTDYLLRLDLAKVPLGANSLTLELVNKEGKTLFRKALALVKRAPKPGHEWKIDQLNGVLLNNGEPFFPFGLKFTQYTENRFEELKRIGFNMFVTFAGPFPDDISDKAETNGLYVMDRYDNHTTRIKIPNLSKYLAGEELKQADVLYDITALQSTLNGGHVAFKKLTRAQRNEIFAGLYQAGAPKYLVELEALMKYKSFMGYNTLDEPRFAAIDMFIQGRDIYRKINEIDGYHPVLLPYESSVPPGSEATDWGDILTINTYWIPDGTLKGRSTINYVSKMTSLLKKRADADRKMTWIVLEGSRWSGTHRRFLTPAEDICQSYLCVIHGAKGISYYLLPEHKLLQDAIRTFGEQLRVLAPALLAPAVKQEVSYRPGEFIPEKDTFPAIQAALFKYPSGEAVLLAANTAERQQKATFSLSCLPEKGEIKRLFKPETFKVSGGSFSDSLEPCGVRAYSIAKGVLLKEPVRILVKSEPDESAPPPAARLPTVDYWGRTGKKNVAPNPSFEEVTVPDLPDYLVLNGKTTVGSENAHMKVVATDPYDGKVCLQLTNREEDTPIKYVGFNVACAPQSPEPETYTWSIYMKGSRDDLEVMFGNHWMKELGGGKEKTMWRTVKLTKEWKRYSITGVIPANVYRKCGLELQLRGYGTIWMDAMQMEKGDTPTVFEN